MLGSIWFDRSRGWYEQGHDFNILLVMYEEMNKVREKGFFFFFLKIISWKPFLTLVSMNHILLVVFT